MKLTKGYDGFFFHKMVNLLKKKCTKVQGAYPRIYNKVQVKTESKQQKSKGMYWRPSSIKEKD